MNRKYIYDKPCKKRKCPYYNIFSTKCNSCEKNPEANWKPCKKGDMK